jgi:hypothetical protein
MGGEARPGRLWTVVATCTPIFGTAPMDVLTAVFLFPNRS